MTKEQLKELLPIMQALVEGKEVEMLYQDNVWRKLVNPDFTLDPENYRIQPKYRPFNTIKECWQEMHKHSDFGWLKIKEEEVYCNIVSIYESSKIPIVYINDCEYSFSDLFNTFTFIDGSPFGIKEEEL